MASVSVRPPMTNDVSADELRQVTLKSQTQLRRDAAPSFNQLLAECQHEAGKGHFQKEFYVTVDPTSCEKFKALGYLVSVQKYSQGNCRVCHGGPDIYGCIMCTNHTKTVVSWINPTL
jgi:hypothetical protein